LVGPPSLDKVAEQRSLALHPNAQQPPSTSGGGSPWVVLTPSSSENGPSPTQPSTSGGLTPGEEPSPVADPRLLLGPCTRVWVVPKVRLAVAFLTRHVRRLLTNSGVQKTRKKRTTVNPKPPRVAEKKPPRRRRPFQDKETRNETALTRELRSCVRCRIQRIRVLNTWPIHPYVRKLTT
jgi:hypothetical protein